MASMDEWIFNNIHAYIHKYFETHSPSLTKVTQAELPNWRHDVYFGRCDALKAYVNKHHLNSLRYGFDFGDFPQHVIDSVYALLKKGFADHADNYLHGVLLPTFLKWIVMSLFSVDGEEAEYYLSKGGENNGKVAAAQFIRQIGECYLYAF